VEYNSEIGFYRWATYFCRTNPAISGESLARLLQCSGFKLLPLPGLKPAAAPGTAAAAAEAAAFIMPLLTTSSKYSKIPLCTNSTENETQTLALTVVNTPLPYETRHLW
jgi:hypothetical protein